MPIERDEDLREKLVARQVLPGGTYLAFARDTVETPDGRQHTRDIVIHPGAVTVAALLTDRSILLVRQYRHAAGEILWELPAGTLDRVDDDSIEDPLAAAKRELTEETGYRAGTWRKLGEFFTAPGFASELMHMYLATDVEPDPELRDADEDERLILEQIEFAEAIVLAERGEIRDAKTLLGLYLVERLAQRGEIAELDDPD